MPYAITFVGEDSETGKDREDTVVWRKPTKSAYEMFTAKAAKVKEGDEVAGRRVVENFIRTLVIKPDGDELDKLSEEYPNLFTSILNDATCVVEGSDPKRSTKSK